MARLSLNNVTPGVPTPALGPGPFVIEVRRSSEPCWLCAMTGDPGRTGVLTSAKVWKSARRVSEALTRVRADYPQRMYGIVPLAEARAR